MRKTLVLFAAVLIFLAGCSKSAPTIDASSDEALKASLQRVQESMPAEKQARFQAAVMIITISGMSVSELASEDSAAQSLERMKKHLHGMTGEEVIAEAEKIRQERTGH